MIKPNKELVEMFSEHISISNLTDIDCWTLVSDELHYKDCCDEYCLDYAQLVAEVGDFKMFEIHNNGSEYYLVACTDRYKTEDEYDEYEQY